MKYPAVVVVTRRTLRNAKYVDYVAEAHLSALVHYKIRPVMVPVVEGVRSYLPDYMTGMCGLLLVEGEDIGPKNFKANADNHAYVGPIHSVKDEIEIQLLRAAFKQRLPIFGICRGSQLMNVVCGGTLHGDVQKEKKSELKHVDYDNYDGYRHSVTIVRDTPMHEWYDSRTVLPVTSYHHQGVRDLAPRFRPLAHAKDGLIEGFYDPKSDFVVGLQFHPERMPEEPEGNLHIWKAFASAVKRRFK